MRAVVYHSWTDQPWGAEKGWAPKPELYEQLFAGLRKNVAAFGMDVIHLTTRCGEDYGHEQIVFGDLKPEDVVYNREVAFARFLRDHAAAGETYWFTEPDARIALPIPPLAAGSDLALLIRDDKVPITPSWRLGRQSSWEAFHWCAQKFADLRSHPDTNPAWNGDSDVFVELYKELGEPKVGDVACWERDCYAGVFLEFRDYRDYVWPGRITKNWKWRSKEALAEQ